MKSRKRIPLILVLSAALVCLAAPGRAESPPAPATEKAMGTLVTAEWLSEHLGEPDLVVLDCTIVLEMKEGGGFRSLSGREVYEESHIPTAAFADLKGELSDTDSPLQFALPTPEGKLGRFNIYLVDQAGRRELLVEGRESGEVPPDEVRTRLIRSPALAAHLQDSDRSSTACHGSRHHLLDGGRRLNALRPFCLDPLRPQDTHSMAKETAEWRYETLLIAQQRDGRELVLPHVHIELIGRLGGAKLISGDFLG